MRAIIVAGMVEDGLRLSKKYPPPAQQGNSARRD
jgi:hypothetical protein